MYLLHERLHSAPWAELISSRGESLPQSGVPRSQQAAHKVGRSGASTQRWHDARFHPFDMDLCGV